MLGCRIVRNSQGKSRGIAFADFKDMIDAEECIHTMDFVTVPNNSQPLRFFKSRPPEVQGGEVDSRTAFVNNVPLKMTEVEINNIFKVHGSIEDIRLIKSTKNPSVNKGICYIQFEDSASIDKCVQKDLL